MKMLITVKSAKWWFIGKNNKCVKVVKRWHGVKKCHNYYTHSLLMQQI